MFVEVTGVKKSYGFDDDTSSTIGSILIEAPKKYQENGTWGLKNETWVSVHPTCLSLEIYTEISYLSKVPKTASFGDHRSNINARRFDYMGPFKQCHAYLPTVPKSDL